MRMCSTRDRGPHPFASRSSQMIHTLCTSLGTNRTGGVSNRVGDVLITGQADEDGDTTGIPNDLLQLITEVPEYKYQIQVIGSEMWSGNGMTYTTYWDALNGGLALLDRWMMAREVRVVAV